LIAWAKLLSKAIAIVSGRFAWEKPLSGFMAARARKPERGVSVYFLIIRS
jgi:hypothetical protein